jgi:signal transduction histidine kinase
MLRSIRARMTAVFSLSVAVLMLLACGALIAYARHAAESDAAAILSAVATKLGRELHEDAKLGDLSELADEVREDAVRDDLVLVLVGPDGRVVQRSRGTTPSHPLENSTDWRTARVRVGGDWLVVGLPWAKTESALRSLTVFLVLLGLFLVAIATVGSWVLVGRTLSPIDHLSRQANTATVEGLQVRLEEPSRDSEIVGLVATLNGLLSRLSEAAEAKGRFYSAASHELRTPLQALSGHLELALNKARTQDEYHLAIEEAYGQTRRLIKLARNLLLLYQLDSAGPSSPAEPGDLAAVCGDALSDLQPLADERGLRVTVDMPEHGPFSAPATHAEVLVRNLLENAIRYANPGGKVDLHLEALPQQLRLTVFNECAVAPEWNPDQLFEPFARFDPSRSSDTGGTGLGLAICKVIADANGWQLALEREGAGIVAVVTIPTGRREEKSQPT